MTESASIDVLTERAAAAFGTHERLRMIQTALESVRDVDHINRAGYLLAQASVIAAAEADVRGGRRLEETHLHVADIVSSMRGPSPAVRAWCAALMKDWWPSTEAPRGDVRVVPLLQRALKSVRHVHTEMDVPHLAVTASYVLMQSAIYVVDETMRRQGVDGDPIPTVVEAARELGPLFAPEVAYWHEILASWWEVG